MSFIGNTEERLIKTSSGKTFKILITEQYGGYWVATVLFAKNGVVDTENLTDINRIEAYRKATEWVVNNIDDKANIDSL